MRPLASLHQTLILSLPPWVPTSPPHTASLHLSLSFSPGFLFFSLSHYFITSPPPSVTISLFHIPLRSISSPPNLLLPSVLNALYFFFSPLFYFFTLFISLPLTLFPPPQIIGFFSCEAAIMERWREGGGEQKGKKVSETERERESDIEKLKDVKV